MTNEKTVQVHDLAIIGGGIAGAGIARDAALRGLSVVLFEKDSFGSGTSGASSKLIHGGLRYLETAWSALKRGSLIEAWRNFRFVRQALRETHVLSAIAPEHVRPLALVLPVYRRTKRSPQAVYFGCRLYGWLARLGGSRRSTEILGSAEKVLARVPELSSDGLLGGALVWDHTTDDSALVRALMASAVRAGAQAHERCAVEAFARVDGVYELRTARGTFLSRKLVDATGPWVDRTKLLGGERSPQMLAPIAGAHIELPKFTEHAVILEAPDHRIFFVIPRGERSRVGTTERECSDPDTVRATDEEIEYLCGAVREYFPKAAAARERVLSSDAGIRPLARPPRARSAHEISREHEFRTGQDGVVHVLGVKLTDHRRAAQELLDRLFPGTVCRTARERL